MAAILDFQNGRRKNTYFTIFLPLITLKTFKNILNLCFQVQGIHWLQNQTFDCNNSFFFQEICIQGATIDTKNVNILFNKNVIDTKSCLMPSSTQAVISFTSTQAVNNQIYTGSQWHQTYTITEYAI